MLISGNGNVANRLTTELSWMGKMAEKDKCLEPKWNSSHRELVRHAALCFAQVRSEAFQHKRNSLLDAETRLVASVLRCKSQKLY